MASIEKAMTPPPVPTGLVRVYAYYRFFLAALLLGLFFSGVASSIFGTFLPGLFITAAASYVGLTSLCLGLLVRTRFFCERYILFLNLLADIAILNLLMFSSGGLSSGIGFLLLAVVATGSLIFTGQMALFLAAFASILVIAQALIAVVLFQANSSSLFPSGLLGGLLFLIALLFRSLNRRLLDSQSMATREADQAAHLQRLNELIVNRMRTGIILVDTSAQIKLINSAAVEHLGGHKPGAPLAVGVFLRTIPELFKQYERWHAYPWLRCPPLSINNSNAEIQCNFARLEEHEGWHTMIFIEDTRSTAQNAQQLKLASLGRLAGSIAHEVRNPLGAISHAAQLMAEQAQLPPSMRQLTDIINRHSERVNLIVDSIMQLSRQQAPAFQKLHLNLWLRRFIEEYADANAEPGVIEISELYKPMQVLFDPVHLNQVMTNLIDNAHRYSTDETGERWAKIICLFDPGTLLPCLDVYDRGPGVDEKHLGQIFEPFFTTSRSGTGLGLYLARERCEFNFATLTYRPNNGQIAGCFRITFAHPNQILPGITDDKPDRADR